MGILEKVAAFLGFLFLYVVFALVTQAIQKRSDGSSNGARVLLSGPQLSYFSLAIVSLLSMMFIFGSIWILCGFFDIMLIGVFLSAALLSIVMQYALGAILTPPNLAWSARRSFFTQEIRTKFPIAFSLYGLVVPTMGLLLPLAVGIVYFINDVPSDYATKRLFAVIFGWSLLCGLIFFVLPNILYICSRNVDPQCRLRAAGSQFAGIGSTVLSLGVLFWSFELPGQNNASFFTRDMLSISPLLLTVLLVYYFCTLIAPYLVGSRQAAMWQHELLQKQQSWVGNLVEILKYPTPALYELKLDVMTSKMYSEIERIMEGDKFMCWIRNQRNDPDIRPDSRDDFLAVLSQYGELDPRLQHIGRLEEILVSAKETRAELARIENEYQLIRRAADFSTAYQQKAEHDLERESLQRRMTVSFAPAMTVVIGAAMTAVIGKMGEVAVLQAFATLG